MLVRPCSGEAGGFGCSEAFRVLDPAKLRTITAVAVIERKGEVLQDRDMVTREFLTRPVLTLFRLAARAASVSYNPH